MKILVLGAGAWGTAVAIAAAARHAVTLWARDPRQAQAIDGARENARYLPGFPLPQGVAVRSDAEAALCRMADVHDLVIVATPMSGLRGMLTSLADCRTPVAWLCKGFEPAQGNGAGLMGHEIRAEVAPKLACGALSGPSFAQEVARGQPTALVAASEHPHVRDLIVSVFHGPTMRIYANDDLVGVEVGGAVKNVLAIATGLCDGLELGLNARAALITRGLAEMTRFGIALGARPETFMGLSGLGDLVLTATGDLSRNRSIGQQLARGLTLQQAVDSLGHVAEGVYSARTVVQRAKAVGVEMPIASAVTHLLEGTRRPQEVVAELMSREARGESHGA